MVSGSIPNATYPAAGGIDYRTKDTQITMNNGNAPLLPQSSSHQLKKGNSFMKYFSLVFLIIQNSTLVLLMRHSRVAKEDSSPQQLYISSTAVVLMEIVKIVTCLIILLFQGQSLTRILKDVTDRETLWPLMVPAALYAIQNNLLYTALSNLDATTFQVSYQLKILTTALFSVALLKKKLNHVKWISLLLLMVGVAMVQVDSISSSSASNSSKDSSSPVLGFFAVLAACFSSGFSGVYFELMIKKSSSSLWARNIQLGIFSFLFSVITMILNDFSALRRLGFFHGYNYITYSVVLNQACGGLIVALVVKYADNILKGFATSVSIVVSALYGGLLGGFRPSFTFFVGSHLVLFAVYFYSWDDGTMQSAADILKSK